MNFNQIFNNTPEKLKLEFLHALISENENFQIEFIEFISSKGVAFKKMKYEEFKSIVASAQNNFIKQLENVDLENPDWDNYTPPHSGYIEDWEQYEQASEQEFERIFEQLESQMFDLLLQQKNDSIMATLIGAYKACNDANIENPVDTFGMSDSINEFLLQELTYSINRINEKIEKIAFPGQYESVITNFLNYCTTEYPSNEFFPKFFEPFLISISDKALNPKPILDLVVNSKIDPQAIPNLILLLNKNCGNTQAWLLSAEKYYLNDMNVALELCRYYSENDKQKLLKLSKELYESNKQIWAEHLSELITHDLDNIFYIKIFRTLTIQKQELKYYKKINQYLNKNQIDELLTEIWYDKQFVVEILEVEKQFEEIKNIVEKNLGSYHFIQLITPIINVYPEFCFNTIQKLVFTSIQNDRGRIAYKRIVQKVQLAQQIDGFEKQTQSLINQLYNYNPALRALKDEFRIGGLV